MAQTFYFSSTDSDLTGGADFNAVLTTSPGTGSSATVSVANSSTETSYGYTPSGVPGTNGAAGNYTVEVNVTAANANITINTAVARVNSSGVVQSGPVNSNGGAQSAGATGVKTFSFTSPNLGTWSAGDRLRVSYIFTSTQSHGGAAAVDIERNTTSVEVVTPFTPSQQDHTQTPTDSLPLSDARAYEQGYAKADGLSLGDSADVGLIREATPTDTLALEDAVALALGLGRVDQLTPTDVADDRFLSKWTYAATVRVG